MSQGKEGPDIYKMLESFEVLTTEVLKMVKDTSCSKKSYYQGRVLQIKKTYACMEILTKTHARESLVEDKER